MKGAEKRTKLYAVAIVGAAALAMVAMTGASARAGQLAGLSVKVSAHPSDVPAGTTVAPKGLAFTDAKTGGPVTPTVDFGGVAKGQSKSLVLVVKNTSVNSRLNLSGVGLSGSSDFKIVVNGCGSHVAPLSACTITIEFTPKSGNAANASLKIGGNIDGGSRTIALQGSGSGN
jgi:Cep192 domain 4